MRGIIIYSSSTGNTEDLAKVIYQELSKNHEVILQNVKEHSEDNLAEYEFVLLGGWVDRSKPDKAILQLLEHIEPKRLGLFCTLGAMPDSEHGQDVARNLEGLLAGHDSLGYGLCPGLVEPAVITYMERIPDEVIPKALKDKMVEVGKASRRATPEEQLQVARYFASQLK